MRISIFAILLSFAFAAQVAAQAVTIEAVAPSSGDNNTALSIGDANGCVYKLIVKNTTTAELVAPTLVITLRNGVEYVPSSATGANSVDESNLQTPVLTLNNVAVGGSLEVSFRIRIACGYNIGAHNGADFFAYKLTDGSGLSSEATGDGPTTVRPSNLSVDQLPTSAPIEANQSFMRTITVRNIGETSIDTVWIDDIHDPALLSLSLSDDSPGVISDITDGKRIALYKDDLRAATGGDNDSFDPGETLTITEEMLLTSCSPATSAVTAWTRDFKKNRCAEATQGPVTITAITPPAGQLLSWSRPTGRSVEADRKLPQFCRSGEFFYRIDNTFAEDASGNKAVTAYNVRFLLGQTSYFTIDSAWLTDRSGAKLISLHPSKDSDGEFGLLFKELNKKINNSAFEDLNGDGLYNDIAPGKDDPDGDGQFTQNLDKSVYIRVFTGFIADFFSNTGGYDAAFRTQISYNNLCGGPNTYDGYYSWTHISEAPSPFMGVLNAPSFYSELREGVFDFTVVPAVETDSLYVSYSFNAGPTLSDAVFSLVVTLPDFLYFNYGTPLPTGSSISGDGRTITVAGYTSGLKLSIPVRAIQNAGANDKVMAHIDISYDACPKKKTIGETESRIEYQEIDNINNTVRTAYFNVKRTSFGFEPSSGNPYQTRVTANTPSIDLKAATAGDNVSMTIKGTVLSNVSDNYLAQVRHRGDIAYFDTIMRNTAVLKVKRGNSELGSINFTPDVATETATDGEYTYTTYTLSLSNIITAMSGISPATGDTLIVEIPMRVSLNAPGSLINPASLGGRMFSKDAGTGTELTGYFVRDKEFRCQTYSVNVFWLRPNGNTSLPGEGPFTFNADISYAWGIELYRYPNELRPCVYLNRIIYRVEGEWDYVPGTSATSSVYQPFDSSPVADPSVAYIDSAGVTWTQLTYVNEPLPPSGVPSPTSWGMYNIFSAYPQAGIKMNLKPRCVKNGLVRVWSNDEVITNFNSDDPTAWKAITVSGARGNDGVYLITYVGMDAIATALAPTVVGVASKAQWQTQIENRTTQTAGSVLKNNWLAFETKGENIRLTKLINTATSTEYQLEEYAAGKYWVKLGDQSEHFASYTIDATYSECTSDSVIWRHGYGYEYPTNPDELPCNIAAQVLKLNPNDMRWTMAITTPDTARFCESQLGKDSVTVDLRNIGSGDLSNLRIRLAALAGLSVRDGSSSLMWCGAEYPLSDPVADGEGFIWNISTDAQSPVATLYSPVSHQVDSSSLSLKFRFKTNCDFASQSRASLSATVAGLCGDSTITIPSYRLPIREGLPVNSNEYEINVMNELHIADEMQQPLYSITVRRSSGGIATDASHESIRITIPDGIDYVGGSWSDLANAAGMTFVSNIVTGNERDIIFTFPNGIGGPKNVPLEFSFNIRVQMTEPAKLLDDSIYHIRVATLYRTDGLICEQTECPSPEVITTGNRPTTDVTVDVGNYPPLQAQTTVNCGSPNYRITLVDLPKGAVVTIIAPADATLENGTTITGRFARAGRLTVSFTSLASGELTTHNVPLEYRLPFDSLVLSRFDNALTVINVPANNGGFTFKNYQWWHKAEGNMDFEKAGNGQSYSAGANDEHLNACDSWWVEAVTTAGDTIRTCENVPCTLPLAPRSGTLRAYPNPSPPSVGVMIDADVDETLLREATLMIYDESGKLIVTTSVSGRYTLISSLTKAGMYLCVFRAKNGFSKTLKLIVQ